MQQPARSYFRGLTAKLAIPAIVGSFILFVYYWKLLHLTADQIEKTLLFLSIIIPISLLWPIPLNRRFARPIIRYLKGKGPAWEAEKAASLFPIRSSLLSLCSWFLAGVVIVFFSTAILRIPGSYRLYLFTACFSAGLGASFVHFHILRSGMEPVRIHIAEEIGHSPIESRYPILAKLLLSFTLLIALSLIFFALMGNARTEEAVRAQSIQLLQMDLNHWSQILENNSSATAFLPSALSIEQNVPVFGDQEYGTYVKMKDGRYLVSRLIQPDFRSIHGFSPAETIAAILLTILLVGLVAYFAAYDISNHLGIIRDATVRIASGDFEHQLQVVTDDEVASLARGINQMAEDLRTKMALLQNARDEAQEKSRLLEEANQELMKLDELKSNFLANISHELKAPLVSTKGYIDFIVNGKLGPVNEKQMKGLTVSRDNLNHLTRLISSLLDFSKITAGSTKLRMQPTTLQELIESCVESIRMEIRRKNKEIDVEIEIPAGLPQIYGDADRIREVLMNLLTNAEKFTNSKGKVTVSVQSPSEEDEFLSVSVSDNGIGISREHLAKVFQRFYQVDGSSTRKYGGTGLGLAIVKEILEAHGCKIFVNSQENVGSTFTFTLPIYKQTMDLGTPMQLKRRPGKHQVSKLVEVVDDDPEVGSLIKMLLEEEGFAVIQARSGREALAIAREHRPDLITLDVYLPDVSGFDLLEHLHSEPATADIPVIVLSILLDKDRGFQLGAADYLEKPIDAEKLRTAVRRITHALDRTEEPLKIMVVDDDSSILEFFEDCLTIEGYQVCTVQGGTGAFAAAKKETPRLILLDLVMPDLEGLEVLQQLKSDHITRNIPVIILTGKARMEERDKSILLGAEDLIAKPPELRNIVDQVKKYFDGAL